MALDLGEVPVDCGELTAAGDLIEAVARTGERHHRPDLLARAALGFAAGLSGFEARTVVRSEVGLGGKPLAVMNATWRRFPPRIYAGGALAHRSESVATKA